MQNFKVPLVGHSTETQAHLSNGVAHDHHPADVEFDWQLVPDVWHAVVAESQLRVQMHHCPLLGRPCPNDLHKRQFLKKRRKSSHTNPSHARMDSL